VLKLRAILIFFLAVPFFGQQPAIPEQLLESVHKNVDLSAAGSYTLTATVVGNPDDPKKQQTGQLRIDCGERYRVELTLPQFFSSWEPLGQKHFVELPL
jgi:hypothetical protein